MFVIKKLPLVHNLNLNSACDHSEQILKSL